MRLKKIAKWLLSYDTGASSMALCAVELGGGDVGYLDAPCDPSDLGRCIRFLDKCVKDKTTLVALMAMKNNKWLAIHRNWDSLMELWNEEKDQTNAPKLFEKMKEIGL